MSLTGEISHRCFKERQKYFWRPLKSTNGISPVELHLGYFEPPDSRSTAFALLTIASGGAVLTRRTLRCSVLHMLEVDGRVCFHSAIFHSKRPVQITPKSPTAPKSSAARFCSNFLTPQQTRRRPGRNGDRSGRATGRCGFRCGGFTKIDVAPASERALALIYKGVSYWAKSIFKVQTISI